MYCFEKRLDHCKTASDILSAISTIYGTELFEDNVNEGKQNLINMLEDFISNNTIKFTKTDMNKFMKILDNNFKCTDTFKWDYDHWCPMKEDKCDALF